MESIALTFEYVERDRESERAPVNGALTIAGSFLLPVVTS